MEVIDEMMEINERQKELKLEQEKVEKVVKDSCEIPYDTAVSMIDEQLADMDRMVEECRRQLRVCAANEATLSARVDKFRAMRASCPPGGLIFSDFTAQVKRCLEV